MASIKRAVGWKKKVNNRASQSIYLQLIIAIWHSVCVCVCVCVCGATHATEIWYKEQHLVPTMQVNSADASWDYVTKYSTWFQVFEFKGFMRNVIF